MRCFDSIRVRPGNHGDRSVRGNITFVTGENEESFELIFTYSDQVEVDENAAGMMLTMAAINFTYFTGKLELERAYTWIPGHHLQKNIYSVKRKKKWIT